MASTSTLGSRHDRAEAVKAVSGRQTRSNRSVRSDEPCAATSIAGVAETGTLSVMRDSPMCELREKGAHSSC